MGKGDACFFLVDIHDVARTVGSVSGCLAVFVRGPDPRLDDGHPVGGRPGGVCHHLVCMLFALGKPVGTGGSIIAWTQAVKKLRSEAQIMVQESFIGVKSKKKPVCLLY